jgi:hypothetical protein
VLEPLNKYGGVETLTDCTCQQTGYRWSKTCLLTRGWLIIHTLPARTHSAYLTKRGHSVTSGPSSPCSNDAFTDLGQSWCTGGALILMSQRTFEGFVLQLILPVERLFFQLILPVERLFFLIVLLFQRFLFRLG